VKWKRELHKQFRKIITCRVQIAERRKSGPIKAKTEMVDLYASSQGTTPSPDDRYRRSRTRREREVDARMMMMFSSTTVIASRSRNLVSTATRAATSVVPASWSYVDVRSSSSPRRQRIVPNATVSSFSGASSATTMTTTKSSSSSPYGPFVLLSRRSFSSRGMGMGGGDEIRRAYPQYTIFGPDAAMSIRAVLPIFKRAGNGGVSVERRGKLVLEFVPRNNTGSGFAWGDKTLFSLTAEEVGLLVNQLPLNAVELCHPTYGPDGGEGGGDVDGFGGTMSDGMRQMGGDPVEKVLSIEPGEGMTLRFKVDYARGGVMGQIPPGFDGAPTTPLEVTIQLGEFEVFKSICQTSIPYILGWNSSMDIASSAAIMKGFNSY
ncbi:hypothetical protein ACHAXA_010168, partial [Cyclostephanos tholiformis]